MPPGKVDLRARQGGRGGELGVGNWYFCQAYTVNVLLTRKKKNKQKNCTSSALL